MTITTACIIEPTKSPKWLRLRPSSDECPIAPVTVRADSIPDGVAVTITINTEENA